MNTFFIQSFSFIQSFFVTPVFILALLFVPQSLFADCNWTVTGTMKVEHQLSDLRTKYGTQSALKGIQVKVSAKEKVLGVWGTFNSWGTLTTGSDGKFSVTKSKNCDERRFKIEVAFDNDDLQISDNEFFSGKWFTVLEDTNRERSAGTISIVPLVFAANKNHDLDDEIARKHADIWVATQKLREHLASYGNSYKFEKKTKIQYPSNSIVSDNAEASYANPTNGNVNIFKSKDGTEDHFSMGTILHEVMHTWAYENVSGELDLATNLIFTGSTHCANEKEHISFHEAFAEFAMERLWEEMYGKKHTLPYNRDAHNEGLECEGETNQQNNLREMEMHEYGWMSLFRMLTTDKIYTYTYAGEAASHEENPYASGNSSVFISVSSNTSSIGCSNPTNKTFKDVLTVFLPKSSVGYSDNLKKTEMNFDSFLVRAGKILGFNDHVQALKNILDPSKTTEPRVELCGGLVATPIQNPAPITPVNRRRGN